MGSCLWIIFTMIKARPPPQKKQNKTKKPEITDNEQDNFTHNLLEAYQKWKLVTKRKTNHISFIVTFYWLCYRLHKNGNYRYYICINVSSFLFSDAYT